MAWKFMIFIIIALIIIIGVHYFLYASYTRFFRITDPGLKRIILIVLLFLAASFILASVLTRYADNTVTTAFYFVSALWWGTVVYLLMAAMAGWLVILAGSLLSLALPVRMIASLLLGAAVLATGYGVWNDTKFKLRQYDIIIQNLPSAWENKRIVQVSDIHLGVLNRVDYLNRLITQINRLQPDIVAITGDFFDGTGPDLDRFALPLNLLKAKKGTYFINGNHETYVGADKVEKALNNTTVRYLRDETVSIDGLTIAGMDYPGPLAAGRTDGFLDRIATAGPLILLNHTPSQIDKAKRAGVSLQLSGHTHDGQIWPLGIFTRLIFGPYHTGLHRDGNYAIYTSTGTGTWGPPVRTGSSNEIAVFTLKNK